jgi:hypothetical protein
VRRHGVRAAQWRTPLGAKELGRKWADRWAAQGGSLPSLTGLARRDSAQHRFGIKKLRFKFSDLLLITNLFEFKMSLNFD